MIPMTLNKLLNIMTLQRKKRDQKVKKANKIDAPKNVDRDRDQNALKTNQNQKMENEA